MLTPSSEFLRQDARILAQQLLGCLLLHHETAPCGGIITETEAYPPQDPAAHSFKGKTPRNASMFLPGGHWYVYLIYGIHYCLNVVSGEEGKGEAVLIRAIEPCYGLDSIRMRRPDANCSGPGRLTQALGITRSHDASPANQAPLRLYLYPHSLLSTRYRRICTRRIGVHTNARVFWRYLYSPS